MVPHVCRLQDASEAQRAESGRRFKEAQEAYEILSDGEAPPRSCLSQTCCWSARARPFLVNDA